MSRSKQTAEGAVGAGVLAIFIATVVWKILEALGC